AMSSPPLPRRERNEVRAIETQTTPHPCPLPQGEREYSLTASSNEPRLCCVRYNSTFVHATLPLPLHRVRTVARADESPRRSLARRLPATHLPLARRLIPAPPHPPT